MEASDFLLLLFAVPGLLIAAWFTLVTYGILPPDARLVPSVCRMDESSCASILHTKEARVLRVAPNALFGLFWYAAVLSLLLFHHPPLLDLLATGAAWAVVGLSAWLAWTLRFRLKTHCPLCYTSHLLNLAIAITLTLS